MLNSRKYIFSFIAFLVLICSFLVFSSLDKRKLIKAAGGEIVYGEGYWDKLKNFIFNQPLEIDLSYSEDIRNLKTVSDLNTVTLDASNTLISGLDEILHMDQLENLFLSETNVHSIKGISKLKNLVHLDLSYTEISNINELGKLTRLRTVNLNGVNLKTLRPLYNLKKLESLEIKLTDISIDEINLFQKKTPNCKVFWGDDYGQIENSKPEKIIYQKK